MRKQGKVPILIFGNSDNCPEIQYLTGFLTSDAVIFLLNGLKGYLVVPEFEVNRAKAAVSSSFIEGITPSTMDIVTPESLTGSGKKRKSLSLRTLRLLKAAKINHVKVSNFFPCGIVRDIEKAGISVTVSQKALVPERAVKTRQEISMIKDAQQAAVIAMRAAITMIANAEIDGRKFLKVKGKYLVSEDVKHIICSVLMDHNCYCREVIVAGGLQAADPHMRGEGPLIAGQAIVIDIFPRHNTHGYWGDLTRTVVRGQPSPKLKKMYYAVKSAQIAALNEIKAGAKCSIVHNRALNEFRSRGFNQEVMNGRKTGFIHNTGHGVGLEIHEAPSLGAGDERLKNGNVVTVEPGLYYPDIGGVRIEDVVVVTSRGWRYLVPCEKKFEI